LFSGPPGAAALEKEKPGGGRASYSIKRIKLVRDAKLNVTHRRCHAIWQRTYNYAGARKQVARTSGEKRIRAMKLSDGSHHNFGEWKLIRVMTHLT
jgi:hypothetical protein